jgi:NDP-sugar pyrophosphorylase family protein
LTGFAAGIIAAGEGSRLAASHPGTIKPMVPVAGRPLSHWVVGALRAAGASRLTVLTNSRGGALPPSLAAAFPGLPFDFLQADTASSFESFRLVSRRLAETEDAFLVSTADAIAPAADVARFWSECRAAGADAGLALTGHVDDEKPLWADVDAAGRVTAVGDAVRTRLRVTCGLYYMTRAAAGRLPAASAHARLRDFWSALASSGARVSGTTLSKTLDVDRPTDVAAAEAYLTTETKR